MKKNAVTHARLDDHKRITHLRVVEPDGQIYTRTRAQVVRAIESGTPHVTLVVANGRKVSAQIKVIVVNDRKWLRTDANRIAADNLENLPSF